VPAPSSYDYAIVRVVPRVERGEFINVGVILFCRTRRFLAARVALDAGRLLALAPDIDVASIQTQLDSIPSIAAGDADGGTLARLPQADRFHWLVAPHSTVIQTSPVHCGLCTDPAATLEDLMGKIVKIEDRR